MGGDRKVGYLILCREVQEYVSSLSGFHISQIDVQHV